VQLFTKLPQVLAKQRFFRAKIRKQKSGRFQERADGADFAQSRLSQIVTASYYLADC
jgi:hypothetical protein